MVTEAPLQTEPGDEPLLSPGLLADLQRAEAAPAAEEPEAPKPETDATPTPSPEVPELTAEQKALADANQQIETFKRQVAEATQREQQYTAQQMEQGLKTAEQQLAASVEQQINTGVSPAEVAQQAARQVADAYRYAVQAQQQQDGRSAAASLYAQQYGVEASRLMSFDTPQAMEAAAQRDQEIAQLKEQLTTLTKAQVTPQKFDSAQPGAGAAVKSDAQRYKDYGLGINHDHTWATKYARSIGLSSR